MKRLSTVQETLKAEIQETRRQGLEQRLTTEAEYDRLLRKLRDQLTEVSPEIKRRIIQTLIHRVVVTKTGFELHYFVGAQQIRQGERVAFPSNSLAKKNYVSGSFKGLNGGPRETRTRTPLRISAFEADVSTIPPEGPTCL